MRQYSSALAFTGTLDRVGLAEVGALSVLHRDAHASHQIGDLGSPRPDADSGGGEAFVEADQGRIGGCGDSIYDHQGRCELIRARFRLSLRIRPHRQCNGSQCDSRTDPADRQLGDFPSLAESLEIPLRISGSGGQFQQPTHPSDGQTSRANQGGKSRQQRTWKLPEQRRPGRSRTGPCCAARCSRRNPT